MSWIGLYRVAVLVVVVVVVLVVVVDGDCRFVKVSDRLDADADVGAAHCTVQLGKIVLGATHSVESSGTYFDKRTSFVKAMPRCIFGIGTNDAHVAVDVARVVVLVQSLRPLLPLL